MSQPSPTPPQTDAIARLKAEYRALDQREEELKDIIETAEAELNSNRVRKSQIMSEVNRVEMEKKAA